MVEPKRRRSAASSATSLARCSLRSRGQNSPLTTHRSIVLGYLDLVTLSDVTAGLVFSIAVVALLLFVVVRLAWRQRQEAPLASSVESEPVLFSTSALVR